MMLEYLEPLLPIGVFGQESILGQGDQPESQRRGLSEAVILELVNPLAGVDHRLGDVLALVRIYLNLLGPPDGGESGRVEGRGIGVGPGTERVVVRGELGLNLVGQFLVEHAEPDPPGHALDTL